MAFWSIFTVTTTLFIIDRLKINTWPRQSFATKSFGTGNDNFKYTDGPWSVLFYEFFARVSGRYTMACLNGLLFTMMHTMHRALANTERGLGRFIDFSSWHERMHVHKILGISLCVTTVIHVWSILLPCIFNNYSASIWAGTATWPASERKPKGFKHVDVNKKHITMQIDDVWRLIIMTIILGPLMYWSVKKIAKDYRFGIRLHQWIALMYFFDIWRRHTHPHSWVLNTPFLILLILDMTIGSYYKYERQRAIKIDIGPDYTLMFWMSTKKPFPKPLGRLADVYYLRTVDFVQYFSAESKHPFTTFVNRMRLNSPSEKLPFNSIANPNNFLFRNNNG